MGPSLRQAVVLTCGLALGFAVLLVSGLLNADDLLVRGELGPSDALIAKDFGPSDNPGMTGFDGQQTYAIAREFPNLDRAAPALDNPRYRMLRILQPAVASLAPPGTALVVALLALGILGCGLATWSVGDFAYRYGHHPRAGWLVGLALVSSVAVTTVDALAYGLALVAAMLADRSRIATATILFAAAALTRESGVVMAAATAVVLFPRLRWRAAPLVMVPAAALLGWYVALGHIVSGALPRRAAFGGLLHVSAPTAILSVVVWLLCVAAAVTWRDTPVLCAIAIAFVLWTLVYTRDVLDFGMIGVFRVNAAIVALGVAGLLSITPTRRTHNRAATSEPVHHRPSERVVPEVSTARGPSSYR
jgi:hypothetical protein